jgi:hypothetical protein
MVVRPPYPDIGVGPEGRVGYLQGDTEDVLVDEKVASREVQIVQKPQEIKEEGVTSESREELVRT